MADPPQVSVLVPAYNVAPYLGRALRSALVQEVPLEVLVVDDGSTDATLAVAQAAAHRDGRVRVIQHARNQGISVALNTAIGQARGCWLAVLAGDDAWLAGRLARLLGLAEAAAADVVADDLFCVGYDGRTATCLVRERLGTRAAPCWLRPHDLLVHTDPLGLLKPIMRRDFVQLHGLRYDPGLRLQEDLHFYLALTFRGARWLLVPDAGYLYYLRPGSAMTNAVALYRTSHLRERKRELLLDPAVRRDPSLLAAVQRHIRAEGRDQRWHAFRTELAHHRWAAVARAAPGQLPMLPRLVAKRWRRLRGPSTDLCLLDAPATRSTPVGLGVARLHVR